MIHRFFELLRVSLGVDNCLLQTPSSVEWQKLYNAAEKQSVLGVCVAGLETLSNQEQLPPKDLLLNWIGISQQMEQRNKTVNLQCLELQKKLDDAGLKYCILKGQGNAQMYER